MITSLLIQTLLIFFNFILGLLPTASLNSSITAGVTNFVNYVYQFNAFFPVDTAITLLSYTVAFWVIVFLWDFLKFLLHLIRGN